MKPFSQNQRLGALKALFSNHIFSDEVTKEFDRFPSQAVIGLGQGGGRIAAEFSRCGVTAFIANSSKSDMDEHRKLIPDERRILTKSEDYPELEGTDKNAQLGYSIAVENKDKYKQLVLSEEIQQSDFVWVAVSLGGGTGNGALKVVLQYLSQVRKNRALPDGKIPLGVICSLPSSDEKGSSFRQNALAGVSVLQNLMSEGKIGSVLVIDNEKIKNYYAQNPVQTYSGMTVDAKSYSNMVVVSSVMEISTLPLLDGRSVLDKTELLSSLSTPAWLSISKSTEKDLEELNIEETIQNLYQKNEVLANYNFDEALNGAVAAMYPTTKNISPKLGDDVYMYASDFLKGKVNLSLSRNSMVEDVLLYGLALVNDPPERIEELKTELDEWKEAEKRQEEKRKQKANNGLDEYDDFFSAGTLQKRNSNQTSLDDLDDDLETNKEKAPSMSMDELDDDF